jgi:hypothetical protein
MVNFGKLKVMVGHALSNDNRSNLRQVVQK